jgi:hypothetical protein
MELYQLNINHQKLVYMNLMFSIKGNQLPVHHLNFMLIKFKQVMLLPMDLVLVMVFVMNHVAFVLLLKMLVLVVFLLPLKVVQKLKYNVKIIKMVHAMLLIGR